MVGLSESVLYKYNCRDFIIYGHKSLQLKIYEIRNHFTTAHIQFFNISKSQMASLSASNKGDSLMYSYCISCYARSNGSMVEANCQ